MSQKFNVVGLVEALVVPDTMWPRDIRDFNTFVGVQAQIKSTLGFDLIFNEALFPDGDVVSLEPGDVIVRIFGDIEVFTSEQFELYFTAVEPPVKKRSWWPFT